jgi:hypothetical protein
VAGLDEARQLQPRSSAGRPQHQDLAFGVGDAGDGVDEFALHDHPALDLETEPDEERRRRVEMCDRDADVIEASDR